MPPGPALALDVGTAKIGVAVSDAGRLLAFPLDTLIRRSVRKDAVALAELARRRGVSALVVGLPPDARLARLARQVAEALGAELGLEPAYVDESYTSVEARERIADAGLPRDRVDAVAAQVILEAWLATSK